MIDQYFIDLIVQLATAILAFWAAYKAHHTANLLDGKQDKIVTIVTPPTPPKAS